MAFDCSHGGGTAPGYACCGRVRTSPAGTVLGRCDRSRSALMPGVRAQYSIDRQPVPWPLRRRRASILDSSSHDSTMNPDPREDTNTRRFSIGAGGAGGEP
jgi:hypothetical protein